MDLFNLLPHPPPVSIRNPQVLSGDRRWPGIVFEDGVLTLMFLNTLAIYVLVGTCSLITYFTFLCGQSVTTAKRTLGAQTNFLEPPESYN